MIVYLTEEEFDYICYPDFLPSILLNKISNSCFEVNNDYKIKVSEEESEEIRDLCGEQLQIKGFDRNYEPTKEGVILEKLIDKFFA
ncbi:MAG: hypothetical protein AAFR63_08940 [Cyanobacteria bacterium J06631_6]